MPHAGPPDLRGILLARIAAHKYYPELARRRGIVGTVTLRFRIGGEGEVLDVVVVASAHPVLDEAARRTLLAAGPLPAVGGVHTVAIEYAVPATAAE